MKRLLCAVLLMAPASSRAQQAEAPTATEQVAMASLNGVIGGAIAGLSRVIRGGSFSEAFLPGTIGGAVAFGGRRLAAERFDGAGFLGRELSAVGASLIRNAGEGIAPLARLQLPVGPVELVVRPREPGSVRPRLLLSDLVLILSAAAQDGLDFDPRASLSAGAAVFRAPERLLISSGDRIAGMASPGIVYLAGARIRAGDPARTFAHERAHILQFDFARIVAGDPLERGAAGLSRATLSSRRFLAPNLAMPLAGAGLRWLGIDWLYDAAQADAEWMSGT